MGRNVAEATNAWRILRTRGDMGRRRRRAEVVLPVFFDLLTALELEVCFDGAEDFWVDVCPEVWTAAGISIPVDACGMAITSPPARASIRAYLRQN